MKGIILTLVGVASIATAAFAIQTQAKETKTQPVATQEADCCASADKASLIVAQESGQEKDCCTSTEENPVKKGEEGCCNAPGELAKFKVWSDGKYYFYGCEGSAEEGRLELVAHGHNVVGKVQPVVGRVVIS